MGEMTWPHRRFEMYHIWYVSKCVCTQFHQNMANTALDDGYHCQICLDLMRYLMQIPLTLSSVVLPEWRNDSSCGLKLGVLPYKYGIKLAPSGPLLSFLMITRSPLGSSMSCTFIVVGYYHNQLASCEMCATGFTTKCVPQYKRP